MQMLGGRAGGAGAMGGGAERSSGSMGAGERGGAASGPPRDDYDQSPAPAGGKEDFDDDIPF
jgi:single-stranded DNA-binding protein